VHAKQGANSYKDKGNLNEKLKIVYHTYIAEKGRSQPSLLTTNPPLLHNPRCWPINHFIPKSITSDRDSL
jgi:hypothetical protein